MKLKTRPRCVTHSMQGVIVDRPEIAEMHCVVTGRDDPSGPAKDYAGVCIVEYYVTGGR